MSLTRSLFLFSGLLVVALSAGCSQQESDTKTPATSSPSTAAATGDFKVALVTPSPVSDKGWGASANEGIEKIKTELSATATPPVESPAPAEFASSFRNLAQDGATIVYGHGSEYDDAVKGIATEFPKTTFVVMGGRATGANLVPIQFQAGQATYLAGMVAAGMSKSGKIGCIGPVKIPIIEAAFKSFTKGAKAVKPNIVVRVTFTGDDKDTAKGKQQAQALLDDGCDVLMHNANAAGAGVFQAVTEKPGVFVIGANADQSDQATSQNLGSFILDVPNAMLGVAKLVKEGKADGKPYQAGLAGKAVYFKFNPGFKGVIPDDLKKKMQKAESDMAAGTLDPEK